MLLPYPFRFRILKLTEQYLVLRVLQTTIAGCAWFLINLNTSCSENASTPKTSRQVYYPEESRSVVGVSLAFIEVHLNGVGTSTARLNRG